MDSTSMKKAIPLITLLSFQSSFWLASNTYAQDSQGFVVGAFDVIPTLGVNIVEDDNVFQTRTDTTDDTITVVTPGLSIVFDNGISGVEFNYQIEDANYSNQTSEDYTDHSLSTTFGWALNDINRLEFSASRFESQDARTVDSLSQVDAVDGNDGDINGVDTSIALDEYEDTDYSVTYTLGNSDSVLVTAISAIFFEKEYTTNQDTTQFNNYESTSLRSDFTWRINSSFNMTASIGGTDIDYDIDTDNSDPTLANNARSDSDQVSYTLGFDWQASEQTSVTVSAGQNERDFSDENQEDTETARWNGSISWSPLSYSNFTFSTARSQNESNVQVGSFLDQRTHSVSWNHDWNDRLSTSLGVSDADIGYEGDVREDDSTSYSLNVSYTFLRWLAVSLFATQEDRDSTVDDFEYERTIYGLNFSVTP
jgi:hypothetical protein